jgi:hypothetical protein
MGSKTNEQKLLSVSEFEIPIKKSKIQKGANIAGIS